MIEAGERVDLSEEFLFRQTKAIDQRDHDYDGWGAYPRSACKALLAGVCLESALPYRLRASEASWRQLHLTSAQRAAAQQYRVASYAAVDTTVPALQRALSGSRAPVMLSFHVHDNYRQAAKPSGRLPPPGRAARIGGHAVLVVGWAADSFVCKNSWGAGFGNEGYLHIPFDVLPRVMISAWSFVDTPTVQQRVRRATQLRPRINQRAFLEAQLARVPDWSRASCRWAASRGVMTQFTGKPMPDYRLAVVLDLFYRM